MQSNNSGNGAGQLPPIRFEALARELLARIHQLVPDWVPGGTTRNGEYLASSPFRAEKSPSFSVRMEGKRAGHWADFGDTHRGGDLISLYAALHHLSMGKAAVELARDYGLEDVAGVLPASPEERAARPPRPPAPPAPPKPPVVDEGWKTQRPVPDFAPEPTFRHYHRDAADMEHVARYQHGDALHGYVVRFRTSDGGKVPLPHTWCVSSRNGAAKWHWRQFDEPRPLYLPGHQLPAGRTVILVEGEKKGDALQALLDAGAPGVYCVASWPGGCKAWQKADLSPLGGCTVIAWADCDSHREKLSKDEKAAGVDPASKPYLPYEKQPGMVAMLGIGARLRDDWACAVSVLPVPQPGEVADGWDCGDAITKDGWDFDRVLAFLAQAQPLARVPEEAAEDAAPAGAPPQPPKKNDPPADAEDGGSSAGGVRGPEWLAPFWNRKKHYWMVSRELVIAALENDLQLVGLFAVNKLTNNIDLRRPLPGSHVPAGPLTGAADLLLGRYLSATYGLPSISRAALSEAIETVAHHNEFHPVRDYLQGLHDAKVWDGKRRLDAWLLHVIGELDKEGKALVPQRVEEYLRLVGRFLLLGMVNRVMQPGCKFDYCMVLEGPGGLRKTTMVQVLAGKAWFSNTHFDVARGKEGQEQVQGLWVYEIAELASFSKADINLIKSFISAEVDRYRPSYGRVVEAFPRQCVMVGTTNEKQWLRDRTGNRRFWPVPVRHCINTDWLAKYRDQLLAEAYATFLQGERYYPTPDEEERLFVLMQDKRLVESTVMSALLEVLTRPATPAGIGSVVHGETQFVTIKQLNEALHVDAGKSTAALDGQIRAWLDAEGWEYCKKQINGVRAHGYARPKDWPRELPDDDADTAPTPAAQPVAAPPQPPMSAAAAFLEQDADDAPF